MAAASDYVFEIKSGLYRGVSHRLGEGRHVVGSGETADLVLIEPALAPLQAAITLTGSTIRVEGLAEDVIVEGAGPVPVGSARTVRLPATIELAGISTRWSSQVVLAAVAPDASARRASGLRSLLRRPAVPGVIAAGMLAVTVFLTIANPIAGAAVLLDGSAGAATTGVAAFGALTSRTTQGNTTPPAAKQAAAVSPPFQSPAPQNAAPSPAPAQPAPALTQPDKSGADKAAAVLRSDVEHAGLINVRIEKSGGAVTATGTIEPPLVDRWQSLQQAFDERFAGDIALVNSVSVKTEKLPSSLGIEGVWRGPQPYIVIRGQRYLVGAVVDGGWAIRGIERDRVMLEREGRLVAMRF